MIEQNNYLLPQTTSKGLFNLFNTDSNTAKTLWNNTDPDNISITFGDYSVYSNNELMSITYGSNAFWTCSKSCKIRVKMYFMVFNQPNLNFCTVSFRNLTTSQNLIQTAIQYLSSAEMGSCCLEGIIDVTLSDLYSFQLDFVGPAPVNITC